MNPHRPPSLIRDKAAERQGDERPKKAPQNHPVKVKIGHRVDVECRSNLQHQGSREHHKESHKFLFNRYKILTRKLHHQKKIVGMQVFAFF